MIYDESYRMDAMPVTLPQAKSDPGSQEIMKPLEKRRQQLRMSRQALADRSGVSIATVNRVLAGRIENASFRNVDAIARALGMSLQWKPKASPFEFKREQARAKAKRLAALVQGTSALEGQAVSTKTKSEIEEEIACRLIAGPGRKLWSA